jgi:integrase
VLNALHVFFSWLLECGHILHMPVFPETKGNDAASRKAMRREEQETALKNIPGEHRNPIEFMMKTGMRPGELCARLVKAVTIGERVVWAERTLSGTTYMETTKNKSTLPMPLNDKTLEIARRNMAGKFPKDFLFINPVTGSGYRLRYLSEVWRTYSGTDYASL